MLNTTHARRADALANHERIVAAAQALFAERGLDAEISEIAGRAGVGVGTLYRHFANRDDLLRATLDKTFSDALAQIGGAVATEDPVAALRAIPHTAAALHRQLGSLFGVMHDPRLARLFEERRESGDQMVEQLMALLEGLVERGVRAGVFRADLRPAIVSSALLGSLGFVFKLQGARRPLDELADELADFYVAILTKQ